LGGENEVAEEEEDRKALIRRISGALMPLPDIDKHCLALKLSTAGYLIFAKEGIQVFRIVCSNMHLRIVLVTDILNWIAGTYITRFHYQLLT
jgi:hypothetical protein